MANPLKMLKIKPQVVQFIVEVPIAAAPKKVWSMLIDPTAWFYFDPERRGKHTLQLKPGGQWTAVHPDGSSMFFGQVSYIEPGKLLRIAGPLALTHLPVTSVIIFELQPQEDGKATLLRIGTRISGAMDGDVKKRMQGGWKQLFQQFKELTEA